VEKPGVVINIVSCVGLTAALIIHTSILLSTIDHSQVSWSVWYFALPPDNAPMYTIPNVAFPVTDYYLEDVLKMTRLAIASPKRIQTHT